MFTGIVETTGEITSVDAREAGRRLRISAPEIEAFSHGQSISVSGVCLTVEAFEDEGWFEVFLAAETVEKTYLGELAVGDQVNIERAMAATVGLTATLCRATLIPSRDHQYRTTRR